MSGLVLGFPNCSQDQGSVAEVWRGWGQLEMEKVEEVEQVPKRGLMDS